MSKTARGGGVRLPLFLLLGFLALVAAVIVWLSLAPAEFADPAPVADAPAQSPGPPPGEKAADPDTPPPGGTAPAAAGPETPAIAAPPETAGHGAPPAAPPAAATPPDPAGSGAAPPGSAEAPPAADPAPSVAPSAAPATDPQPAEPPERAADTSVAPLASETATGDVRIARLPPVATDPPLAPAPVTGLVQETPLGPLPQKSSDGRSPWRVYAKPFDRADPRPRVAIVVTGLGLSAAATESAIQGLPGSVTLAFAPYAPDLNEWIRLARAAGHEVLLNVPMEPVNYPAYDPGPQTLLTSLDAQVNQDRLLWILSRGTGYVGVIDFMGSKFTASVPHLSPVLAALNERGLLFLDSGGAVRSGTGEVARAVRLPWAETTLTLDERASRTEIDKKFAELEKIARASKRAIGIASPYPVALERIATWSRQLVARGIAVAPVSALVETGAPAGPAAQN